MAKVTHGIGFIRFSGGIEGQAGYDNYIKAWKQIDGNQVNGYIQSKEPTELNKLKGYHEKLDFSKVPNEITLFLYDAIIALGLAACQLDGLFSGKELFRSFKNVSFEGASGPIKFNPITGSRESKTVTYITTNAVANSPDRNETVSFSLKVAAIYATRSDNTENTAKREWIVTENGFNYTDKTNQPPSNLPPVVEEQNFIKMGVLAFGLCLAGVVICLSVLAMVWTFQNRKSHIVRVAQPEFLVILCVGTLLMGSSIIPMSLHEPVSQGGLDMACMAVPWLFSIGFVISFSALFSKTWRINKIFHAPKGHRIVVKAKDVILPFMVFLFLNIFLLTLWTFIVPLKWNRAAKSSFDTFGRPVESVGQCRAEEGKPSMIFETLLLVLNLSCLIFSIIQAYLARKIETDFGESCYIFISMISILQTTIIGISVQLAPKSPTARYLSLSVFVAIICTAVLVPLFVPKLQAGKDVERVTVVEAVRRSVIQQENSLLRRGLKQEDKRMMLLWKKNKLLVMEFDNLLQAKNVAPKHSASNYSEVFPTTFSLQNHSILIPIKEDSLLSLNDNVTNHKDSPSLLTVDDLIDDYFNIHGGLLYC